MLAFALLGGAMVGVIMMALGFPLIVTPIAFAILAIYTIFSYYASSSIALSISGAHEVAETEEPALRRTVENLCIGAGLPMPKVYVIEDGSPNAFATGRDPD